MTKFQQALSNLEEAETALSGCGSTFEALALESSFDAALKAACKKVKPKAKYNREKVVKVLGEEQFDVIKKPFVAEADAYYKDFRQARDEARDVADNLAEQVELEPSPHWRELIWYSTHTWSSAGDQYGRGRAEIDAAAIEALGLEAQIVPSTRGYNDWVVKVRATELSVEALKRRGLMTIREFLKACWSRALNPRVYRPLLPHGLEQRLGVTWQGQDVEGWEEG